MPSRIIHGKQQKQRLQVVATATALGLSPPIGGWNTRDSLANMPVNDAIELDNMNPSATDVSVRGGSSEHSDTQTGDPLETAASFKSGSTTKLITVSSGTIWNSTASGNATSLQTGFSNSRFQTANFSNTVGGSLLHMVNGADTPQSYDGSVIAAVTWTGVTGGGASDLIGVNVFKNRLFFWKDNDTGFWYTTTTSAQSGALSFFELGGFSKGKLMHMSTWTLDGGAGPDDLAVFTFSSGDVVVYQGTDPSDATKWAVVGSYSIGAPLGIRAVVKASADVIITTNEDYKKLKDALVAGGLGTLSKASGAIEDASITGSSLFGWDTILYPRKNQVIFNVPNADSTFDQHVLNVNTGAWSRWKDYDARCWVLHDDDIYFGTGDGTLIKADTGSDDDGSEIVAVGRTAWADFDVAQRKHIKNIRALLTAEGTISYQLGIGFDFQPGFASSPTSSPPTSPLWDDEFWDTVFWGDEVEIDVTWRAASGSGVQISFELRLAALQSITWLETSIRATIGNAL